ncbi:MAG: DNA-processing protein DprA [Parabacteroides sp.]
MTDPRIYQIALTMIPGVGDVLARQLLQQCGNAEAVFQEKKQLLEKIPRIGDTLSEAILNPAVLQQAERELAFVEKNHIQLYYWDNPDYPARLKECEDAPVLFYFKGNANLDASHILSIVGTRQATSYGRDQVEKLLNDLSVRFPDLLIVSGLAYGIDICAHQQALHHSLPTVGVLAHGLDRIYPNLHRPTAVKMLDQGGLLTDFPSGTEPDRPNFVRRNRIIAGLADATLVAESAEHGGSLITADLAFSYGRDVFAFPGRITDVRSKGCHKLIMQNKAALITCAEDLIAAMRWDIQEKKTQLPKQAQILFPESDEKQQILSYLHEHKEAHINELSLILHMPVQQLSTLLFEMELDGILKTMPGNVYKPL